MSYLRLKSKKPGATGVILDTPGTSAGNMLVGTDWVEALFGDPIYNPVFATVTSGTSSQRLLGEDEQAREFQRVVQVHGTSGADLAGRLTTLIKEARYCCRFGGRLTYRPTNASRYVHFDATRIVLQELHSQQAQLANAQDVKMVVSAQPWALTDPFDVRDTFATDTTATGQFNLAGSDWTLVSGSLTGVTVTGGVLTASGASGAALLTHTGTGNVFQDAAATARLIFTTFATGLTGGCAVRVVSAATQIVGQFRLTSATTGVVDVVVNGVTRATSAAVTLDATTKYWIRARVEGNVAFSELLTTSGSQLVVPQSATYQLTAAETVLVGASITGTTGLVWNTSGAGSVGFDEFRCEPCTYRNRVLPDEIDIGTIPGDTEALMDLSVSGAVSAASAVFGWGEKPEPFNFISNSGGESTSAGWSAAATGNDWVTTSAGTMAINSSEAYDGLNCLQVTMPAAAGGGAWWREYRRFKRGVTYTATVYAKLAAASAASTVELKAGRASDAGTGTVATALTTSGWTQFTVTWTPQSTFNYAEIALRQTTALAAVVRFDQVQWYEGTVPPLVPEGGSAPFGVIDGAELESGSLGNISAAAAYRSGYGPFTFSATAFEYQLLPWAVQPDDYSAARETLIDVYARVDVPTTATGVKVITSVSPDTGSGTDLTQRRYSMPSGASGVSITTPASSANALRPVFLGTVALPVNRDGARRWRLRLEISFGAGTGPIGLDYLVLVPNRRSATSITGVPFDTSYQAFGSNRLARWDHQGGLQYGGGGTWLNPSPFEGSSTLRGAQMLLPPERAVQLVAWMQQDVIDQPGSATMVATTSTMTVITLHAGVQPRVAIGAG